MAFSVLRSALPVPVPAAVAGALYGLLVWAGAYKLSLPWLGLMPRPERDRPGRPATMILAHLVYGATLGAMDAAGGRQATSAS
jgi:hypothetical protein